MEEGGRQQARELLLSELSRLADDLASAASADIGSEAFAAFLANATLSLNLYATSLRGTVVTYEGDPSFDEKCAMARRGERVAFFTGPPDLLDESSRIGAGVRGELAVAYERAGHISILPTDFSRHHADVAAHFARSETAIQGDTAEVIRARLGQAGWNWLFHVTRVERLESIARYGLVDSGLVDLLELDPAGDDARRAHGNRYKQEVMHHRVSLSFWPAWWLFKNAYKDADVAILAVDAAAACLQPHAIISPEPVASGAITVRDIDGRRNVGPTAIEQWNACWHDGLPTKSAEVATGRVHPVHIHHVLFANEHEHDRWADRFRDAFVRSYPGLAAACPKTRATPLEQGGHPMWFPPSHRRASRQGVTETARNPPRP